MKKGRNFYKQFSKTLIVLLTIMIGIGMIGESRYANALDSTEWTRVRGYINSYITDQYGAGDAEGEAGFLVDQAALKTRLVLSCIS